MNTEKVRARFKYYRIIIAGLADQIQQAQNEAQDAQYWAEEQASQSRERARRAECARIDAERQAESDRWYHESELRRATSDLERARSWGDSYRVDRALDKLKRLS